MALTFDREQYGNFIDILTALSKKCSDCEIRNGRIRIRSDNKIVSYDIKLDDSFNNVSLTIVSISEFLNLAKIFLPTNSKDRVEIDVDDRNLTLKDNFTSVTTRLASSDVCNNPFITDEELDKNGINEKILVFKSRIPFKSLARMQHISKSFISIINIIIQENKSLLTFESESKTKNAKFDIIPEINDLKIGRKHITNSLIIDHPFNSDVYLNVYFLQKINRYLAHIQTNDEKTNIYCGIINDENA